MHILDTERLRIRQLRASDVKFYLGLLNEPSFHQYIGDKGIRDEEAACQHLMQGPIKSYRCNGFGVYLVCLKLTDSHRLGTEGNEGEEHESEVPIGICGLVKRAELNLPDLAAAFKPDYWRSGYAYEAALSILNFDSKKHQLDEILAVARAHNSASQRYVSKLGFIKEDVRPITPGGEDFVWFRWRSA